MFIKLFDFFRAFIYYFLLICITIAHCSVSETINIYYLIIRIFGSKRKIPSMRFMAYIYSDIMYIIYKILGLNIYISKNIEIKSQKILWISNHRSKLDGIVIQHILCICGSKVSSIIKKSVLYIPFFGIFSLVTKNILISRNLENSMNFLINKAKKFINNDKSILIFPEGATMSLASKKKSDEFAQKNNIYITDNLLIPRISGYDIFKNNGEFEIIGNLTIRYPELLGNNNSHSYLNLFFMFPRKLYIDIEYLNESDVELISLFSEKDEKINNPIDPNLYTLFTASSDSYINAIIFGTAIFFFFHNLTTSNLFLKFIIIINIIGYIRTIITY